MLPLGAWAYLVVLATLTLSFGGLAGPSLLAFVAVVAIASIALALLVWLHQAHDATLSRLEREGVRDPVSGLPNRRGLSRRLLALPPAAPAAVVAVKIERLALVWESMGRSEAEAILREAVSRLGGALGADDVLARTGGSTFAILLTGPEAPRSAERLARRVRSALDEPLVAGASAVHVRAAIGIAADGDVEDLLNHALLALGAGRTDTSLSRSDGVPVFEPGLREAARYDLQRDADFKRGLDAGQVIPWFQPIVDLKSGRLHGFEALARWVDEHGDVHSPADFIPRAQRTGLAVELDRTIMRQACQQVGEWMRAGLCPPSLRLSVNLCAEQFETDDLVPAVAAALGAAGVAARQLHIELTEQSLVADDREALRALNQLKELGVVLGVDDFGTGWSMLSYLQRFPIDVLKIDRSFIAPIGRGGSPRLAASIVAMSETLGLTAIAEGIETREQFRLVRDFGCRLGQGYHFSAPVPADEAADFFSPRVRRDAPSASWVKAV